MASVLVPWRGGCPHREAAWRWVAARYAERHPGWRVIRCECPNGPWVKALAVMPVVAECPDGPVIVADADCWCAGLGEAVAAVEAGAPWAVPHRRVNRLSASSTAAVLDGADPHGLPLEEAHVGVRGGGIVIARRDTLLDVPLDPRFEGWGGEDASWGIALTTLAGQPWRGSEGLIHLWHPPQERPSRLVGSQANHKLNMRYLRAAKSKTAMRALVAEIGG